MSQHEFNAAIKTFMDLETARIAYNRLYELFMRAEASMADLAAAKDTLSELEAAQ